MTPQEERDEYPRHPQNDSLILPEGLINAFGPPSQEAGTTEESTEGAAVIPSRPTTPPPPMETKSRKPTPIFSMASGISEAGEKEDEEYSLPPAAEDAAEKEEEGGGGVIITPAEYPKF
ncbi:hypothetical protein RUND412_005348, partial [Rhizina undulata]